MAGLQPVPEDEAEAGWNPDGASVPWMKTHAGSGSELLTVVLTGPTKRF